MLAANLICMASMLIWALAFPAADLLLKSIAPLPLAALRMVLATAFLLPLWARQDGLATLCGAPWRKGLFVGGIGFGIGAYLLLFAQSRTDAVTVAIIAATMPVVGILLERVHSRRPMRARLIVGLALSLVGGMYAYFSQIGAFTVGLGAVAAFTSVAIFSWGSQRTVVDFPQLSNLGRTTITCAGAAGVLLLTWAISAASGAAPTDWSRIGLAEIGALAIYGFGSLAISQLLWLVGVERLGLGVASMHINAAPFYVMIFAVMAGGPWNWAQATGATIVILGVLIAQGRFRA
ncbi:EamA-like transporter family protein [Defluviimonas denitrificans]|jgi:drug/metabolite transporter (DMT)-like permease|uniref:EamA-like transporter family protein n=2 Tax=Albidovulum denitrificans TaxID=404881 RepID=A0A2S8SDQ3_9RHOB|nr:EamA-like transporter family protein [Defluviimonas denitrificans]